MKRKLTKEDRVKLKSSTRIGYVFSLFLFIPALAAWLLSKYKVFEIIPDFVVPLGILLSLLILFLVNRKYWIDLIRGEKDVFEKIIDGKESKREFEAGSSVGISTNGKKSTFYSDMVSHMEYYIIVDNVKYRIDKEIWNKIDEKDKVEFHLAPKSKEILAIK
ncbi:MAG: hypothetical protein ACLFVR_13070 [Thiohalospira sp.]